jgi:hypothetical protein
MPLAHLAGLPVEEALLAFVPAGAGAAGLALAWLRCAVGRRPARR